MLSGEILNGTALSVALLPPPALLELCRTMTALAALANQQNIDDTFWIGFSQFSNIVL